jgi:hypothetical protein
VDWRPVDGGVTGEACPADVACAARARLVANEHLARTERVAVLTFGRRFPPPNRCGFAVRSPIMTAVYTKGGDGLDAHSGRGSPAGTRGGGIESLRGFPIP